jgi:hypothetical protein
MRIARVCGDSTRVTKSGGQNRCIDVDALTPLMNFMLFNW